LDLPFVTPDVQNEIESAQKNALDKWSKNDGAKQRNKSNIKQLISKNYASVLEEENIPRELAEYLQIFKKTITSGKYQNAYRYLTNKQYENYFKQVLETLQVLKSDTVTSNIFTEKTNKITDNQNEIKYKLEEIHKNLNPTIKNYKYKVDAKAELHYFLNGLEEVFSEIDRGVRLDRELKLSDITRTLKDLILDNEYFIVLKGLPGSGKSFELKKLALELWNDDGCDFIPLYRNLRNFTISETIDSFFDLSHVNQYVNVVFILDGLDEINDEDDFISKLNTFLAKNYNESQRFILSCRSNVIENYKNEFRNFLIYELYDLELYQAQRLLYNETNYLFDLETLNDFSKTSSFLNDPYKLKLVANYYNKKKALEPNPSLLWDKYFNNILDTDKIKLRKKHLPHYTIRKDSKVIAFMLESTKEINITEDQLFEIMNNNESRLKAFINSAIIYCDNRLYIFEHKQLQEYLAGLLLSTLDVKEIIKIISVGNLKKIKPSIENTVTLMLTSLEYNSLKKIELLDWVAENEPELLFNADADRVESLRVPVFQSFFENNCIESTIWINRLTSISNEQIGRFADCDENFDYLMKIVQNDSMHFRVRTSAIEILQNFEPRTDELVKNKFFELLINNPPEGYENINSSILELFIDWELYKYYGSVIEDIISLFDGDDHTAHTTKILQLILLDIGKIRNYEAFILKEFKYEFENHERKNNDNVARGNSWRLELVLLNIKSDELYLNYFKKLLDSNYLQNYYSGEFFNKYVEKIIDIKSKPKGEKILITFFKDWLNSEPISYSVKDILIKIINDLKIEIKLFDELFKVEYFKDNFNECARLIVLSQDKKNCLDIFKERLSKFKGLDNELEYFRNVINSNGKKKIAIEVEELLLENGFTLKKQIKYSKTFEDLKIEYQNIIKKELKLILKKDGLSDNLKAYFDKLDGEEISTSQIYNKLEDINNENSLYNVFGFNKIEERFILEVLRTRGNKKTTLHEFLEKLKNEPFYVNFVFTEIINLSSNKHIDFKDISIDLEIQNLLNRVLKEIKTDDLIKFNNEKSFFIRDYSSFQIIQHIHKLIISDDFDLNVEDAFILKTLKYFNFNDYNKDLSEFERLCNHIDDKEALKQTIIENLEEDLIKSIYEKHAMFALKNEIEGAYSIIEKDFIEQDSIYNHDQLLESFVNLNGTTLLKRLAGKDIRHRSCWTAISMLMKREKYQELCAKKAIEYIELNKKNSTENLFLENASNVLFELNRPEIINYIFDDLEHRLDIVFKNTMINFSNYTQLPEKGIIALEDFFHKIYKTKIKSDFNTAYLNRFFATYLSNLVTEMKMYDDVRELLLIIKKDVEENNDDSKLYYINALIRDIENTYINSLSKGLSFDEAIEIVRSIDEIKY
jgi:adenylate kinase family enzyme